AEFKLAVMEKPELLLQYDMVGNGLDRSVDPATERSIKNSKMYGGAGLERDVANYLKKLEPRQGMEWIREEYITKIGGEQDWNDAAATSHKAAIPFDEPTLGIIGMWRLGGGANPHFSLALGEIMLRVGQRYIAWSAYERAALLADLVWPDPSIQKKFVEHCRRRQELIEAQIPSDEREKLRPRFQAELKYGQDYQKAYRDYESVQIRQGASLDDSHFYDAF